MIQGEQGDPGVDGGINSWGGLTGTIDNAEITTTLNNLGYGGTLEVFKATTLTTGLEDSVTLPEAYTTYRTVRIIQVASSEVRIKEIPVYFLMDTNLANDTTIRAQGDTDVNFNSTTRVISVPGGAAIIYQVVLEN